MATVEINLWGEQIRLTSAQDHEFVQRVADYLNDKMKEVQASDPTLINTRTAALRAAFKIAAEHLILQQEVGKIELEVGQIEEQLKKFLE